MSLVLSPRLTVAELAKVDDVAEAISREVLRRKDLLIAMYEGKKVPRAIQTLHRLAVRSGFKVRAIPKALAETVPSLAKAFSKDTLVVSSTEEGALAVGVGGQEVLLDRRKLEKLGVSEIRILALLRQIGDDPAAFRKLGFVPQLDSSQDAGHKSQVTGHPSQVWVVGEGFAQFLRDVEAEYMGVKIQEKAA